MTMISILGGGGLIAAAYAFHIRARLLGSHALGWPHAPRAVLWAIDAALLPTALAGLWWIATGKLPEWLSVVMALSWAAYGGVMAFNVGRQRGSGE